MMNVLIFAFSQSAYAWGKRGHAIVCQTAAAILAANIPSAEFLKKQSFDLGYYCNVPDLVWKKPSTYETEGPQHFMDLEIFERAFKTKPSPADPFELSRGEFQQRYPNVPLSAGRSFWRIQELVGSLGQIAKTLRHRPPSQSKVEVQNLQEDWLIQAGAVGHYIGDLSQPLHVTENYDGVMTDQKGIHAFFEDTLVDELSSRVTPAQLESRVGKEALEVWSSYEKSAAKLSTLQLIENLSRASNEALPRLLKLDKETGRKDLKKAASAFEPIIRARLEAGALAIAEIWSRELGWNFDGDKFYNFTPAPDFIAPPTAFKTKNQ